MAATSQGKNQAPATATAAGPATTAAGAVIVPGLCLLPVEAGSGFQKLGPSRCHSLKKNQEYLNYFVQHGGCNTKH